MLFYSAVVCFVIAVVTMALGFAGLITGAGGLANVALISAVVLATTSAVVDSRRHGWLRPRGP